jgi:hypothetical protein
MRAQTQTIPQNLILLAALPVGAFAAYIVWLVVPQIVGIVVPLVVEQLTIN